MWCVDQSSRALGVCRLTCDVVSFRMSELALSVVVPCFNLERYIESCLDSLAHVGRAGQVIVVDDGSTDGSAERIRDWAQRYDGCVDTIFHPINRGAPVAFNAGLARATEALIC